jgi:Protein of unknown function (DUF2934)
MDVEKHARIERRAYALWQAEGQPDGRHEEHWQRAMRELEAEENGNAAAKRTPRRRKKPAA